MNKKQRGFGIVEFIIIIVAVGIVVTLGFVAFNTLNKDKAAPVANKAPEPAQAAKKQVWTKGDVAVAGKYADADVIKIDDKTWRLYYASQPEGGVLEVYSSTSTDGKVWTADPGVRKKMATFPDVVKLADGRYRMYFQNAGVIKSALSDDGLNFVDEPGSRVTTTNDVGLAFDNVAAPTVAAMQDGSFVMVYRGTINQRYAANTPNPSTQLLMWATSPDGLAFTQKGIAVDSRNDTLNGQLDGPDLVKFDSSYRVFATSYTGAHSFSFDGSKFDDQQLAYAGNARKQNNNFVGAPPGDPTLAEINGTWYMYYGDTGATSGIYYATLQ